MKNVFVDVEVDSVIYDKVGYETFTIDSIRVCNNHYAQMFYSCACEFG